MRAKPEKGETVQTPEVIIETLDQFMAWVKQFNAGQYLFRGLSKECYKQEASACRRLTPMDYNVTKLLDITKETISDARDQGHDDIDGRPLSDLELLAKLQHFGAATCLIDFSRNALVALWFACRKSSKGAQKNGKVCAIRIDNPLQFKKVTHDLVEKDIDCFFQADEVGKYPLYQWTPNPQNNRIIAQSSIFIFGDSTIDADFECVIKIENKQKIIEYLDRLFNINEASMFPDFDGFVQQHADDKPRAVPDFQAYLRRGIEAHQKRDFDQAILHYSNAIRLNPTTAVAHNNRGSAYQEQGNLEKAIADYDRAIELKPYDPDAYYNRGNAHRKQGNLEKAIADYDRAIELKPDYATAYQNRGGTYQMQGNLEKATADFRRAEELLAESPKV